MRIPKAILEIHEYRKDIIEEVEYEDYEEERVEEEEELLPTDLSLTEEFSSVKERTNYALVQLYEQKGYDIFKKVCLNMKGNSWFSESNYGTFKGETAEVFLYITIQEFINKFNLPWKVYLSLVIPHRSGAEGATTEIDTVLVSEEMITVFESKSYNGNKKIIDICSIKRGSDVKDIYGQNALHCESLIKQIADFNINDQKGMKSILFSFAEGSLVDEREEKYKKLMPVVDENTLLAYLTSLTKLKTKYWKGEIYNKFDQLSYMLTLKDHMKHLNSKKKQGE